MEPYERYLDLNGVLYHIRFTPKKVIERGTGGGKKATLGMALGGVEEIIIKKGPVEVNLNLGKGKPENWVKAGKFREIDSWYIRGGYEGGEHSLTLNLKNTRIRIDTFNDGASILGERGTIGRRKYLGRRWETVNLTNPLVL